MDALSLCNGLAGPCKCNPQLSECALATALHVSMPVHNANAMNATGMHMERQTPSTCKQAAVAVCPMPCAGCTALSTMLEHHMQDLIIDKVKQAKAEAAAGSEVQTDAADQLPSRKGRRMPVSGLSETQILDALGSFCDHVASEMQQHPHVDGEKLQSDCSVLMTRESAHALEEHIFAKGSQSLLMLWCVQLAQLCSEHQIIDSGEL